jgi:dynein heavy chain
VTKKTLHELSLALNGIVPMSNALDKMYLSLLKNQVPELWKSYPCLKPLSSWVNDLVERVQFVRD